jgi:hypothetical protein
VSRILAVYPIGVAATLLALTVALAMVPSTPRVGGPIYLLIPGHGETRSLPIAVVDQTGHLLGANAAIDPFASTGVRSVPGYTKRIRLTWLGGRCDRTANVRLAAADPGVRVTVETFAQGTGCLLIAIGRSIDLLFDSPIDPAAVMVDAD